MNSPELADLYTVFTKCRNLPESQRAAFLDVEVKDDDARRQIEQMLKIDAADASFATAPVDLMLRAATAVYEPLPETVGTIIGQYTLKEQIGEGGMGVVFVAEQTEPVQCKVALKLIKPGMDTQQVIARFEAGRQSLALMDHPNIAKFLDAGITASRAASAPRSPNVEMHSDPEADAPSSPGRRLLRRTHADVPRTTRVVHHRLPSRAARAPEGHYSPRHQARKCARHAD